MTRRYAYVGPEAIRRRGEGRSGGTPISCAADVTAWAHATEQTPSATAGGTLAVTFVIEMTGRLLIADRHSEHVACAGGGDVLSAGEMFFAFDGNDIVVEEVTNLSTGYCPEPESWPAVARALDAAGIAHPSRFSTAFVLRRCDECGQRNVVKDGWFHCDACGATLPEHWNFT